MKIVSTIQLSERFQVTFDDGSVWSCDPDGTNWRKQSLSTAELQAKFDATNDVQIAPELKQTQDAIQKPSPAKILPL